MSSAARDSECRFTPAWQPGADANLQRAGKQPSAAKLLSDELIEERREEQRRENEQDAAQVYDDLDDRQRADRIDDICDSLSEENVPPDALAPIRAYAGWLRDGVLASENECDVAALLREFEQLPVRRVTDQTVVMERSPLDGWRARCGQAVRRG